MNLLAEWERTRIIFPIIYQEALFNGDDKIRLPRFAAKMARRLRFAKHPARTNGNAVIVENLTIILAGRGNLDTARQELTNLLGQAGLLVGYVVLVAEEPTWSLVFFQGEKNNESVRSPITAAS